MVNLDDYLDIMTAKDIAKYLGIGYVKALNLIKYSGMPYIKIGNCYRVNKSKFQDWLSQDIAISVLN